jgi:hypothetical protein
MNGPKGELAGFASLVFCLKCGSAVADTNHWTRGFRAAVIACYECGNQGELTGFTAGRTILEPIPDSAITSARRDAARLPEKLGGRFQRGDKSKGGELLPPRGYLQ